MARALVLQSEHERTLEKLQHMQLNNLTAKQQIKLLEQKNDFSLAFCKLSYSFLGLSEKQLKEFKTSELKTLDKLISRKAWPWAICQMFFTFGIPFIGWLFGSMAFQDKDFKCWLYLRSRKYLRKVYRDEFSSVVFDKKLP